MNQVVVLALLGLVAVLAWPRLRSHRFILSLMYRAGQVLLVLSVLAAGTAVVFPWGIQAVVLWIQEHTPEVVAQTANFTLEAMLAVGSLVLLVLLAPLAAWKEAQKALASTEVLSNPAKNGAAGPRNGMSFGAATAPPNPKPSNASRPEREELQAVLSRMKQTGSAH